MLYFFGNVFSAHGTTLPRNKNKWKRNGHGAECTAAKGGDASSSSALAKGLEVKHPEMLAPVESWIQYQRFQIFFGTQIFTAI